eukprot:TRINITY_DN592_c0_g1_i5.p1 TRINITY_DN592_c0_g1~~TRINITY_DN592_c0_g1_i5.p1  ORF type:complete len:129 (-),score=18.61 TRINITY_DN592_c0_g1_i5:26-412(-)
MLTTESYGQGDYHKRSAEGGDHGHSSGPYCEDKKEKQCHKHPTENYSPKSPSRLARKLWTPFILKSVRKESTPIVRNHMREVTTALVLLTIIQRLLLLLTIPDTMKVTEVITNECFVFPNKEDNIDSF